MEAPVGKSGYLTSEKVTWRKVTMEGCCKEAATGKSVYLTFEKVA